MLLPGPIAGFLVEQYAATKTAIPSIKLRPRPPRLRAYADYALEQRLQQELAVDEMGFGGQFARQQS